MSEFSYEALASDGSLHRGKIDADDRALATRQIEGRGLIVVRLEQRQEGEKNRISFSKLFERKLTQEEITILMSDLASLVQSHLHIDEAIRLMLQELELGNARKLLVELLKSLSAGKSLSQAMAGQLQVFNTLEVEMVRFAETSGDVGATLQQIAQDRELRARISNQISSSLRYPAFLLFGSLVIMVFFLVYVIPQFEVVLATSQVQETGLQFVFALSRALKNNSDWIMGGALVLLTIAWIMAKSPIVQGWFRQILLRLPVVGGIVYTYRNARICLLIAQTQRAGIELPIALSVIGPAVDGSSERAISREAVAGLRQGRRLSDVLGEYADLQELALRMLKIGEETGQVAAMADRAAVLYEARAQRQLTRLIAIIGPATLVVISVVIGGLIVLIMSALLSINDLVAL